jgi:hypothetical protein
MAIRQEPEPEICRSGMPGLNTQPQQTRLEFSRRSTPWPATWEPAPVQLAVVMFSGHGTVIRNQFYLVPYRADSSPPVRLEGSAIPAQQPVPRRNPGACPAWPGPGPTRRLPLAQPDRRPIEHAAGRGNRCGLPPFDGAYLLDGRHGLARDERWRTAPSPKSCWRSTPFIYL